MKPIQAHWLALLLPLAAACSARENSDTRVPAASSRGMYPALLESPQAGTSAEATLPDGSGTPAMTGLDGATAAPTLADSDIVAIVHIAHTGEIEQAKVALKRTKDARIRRFAERMVKHHADADAQAKALADRNKLAPTPSFVGTALASDGIQALSMIAATEGAELDRAYLDVQIAEHQAALEMLDQKLLPSAQLPELKDYLTSFRASAAAHLAEARTLREGLPTQRPNQPPEAPLSGSVSSSSLSRVFGSTSRRSAARARWLLVSSYAQRA